MAALVSVAGLRLGPQAGRGLRAAAGIQMPSGFSRWGGKERERRAIAQLPWLWWPGAACQLSSARAQVTTAAHDSLTEWRRNLPKVRRRAGAQARVSADSGPSICICVQMILLGATKT